MSSKTLSERIADATEIAKISTLSALHTANETAGKISESTSKMASAAATGATNLKAQVSELSMEDIKKSVADTSTSVKTMVSTKAEEAKKAYNTKAEEAKRVAAIAVVDKMNVIREEIKNNRNISEKTRQALLKQITASEETEVDKVTDDAPTEEKKVEIDNEIIALGDGFSTPDGTAELFYFLNEKIGSKMRVQFCHALGIKPGNVGDAALFIFILSQLTQLSDKALYPCFLGTELCALIVNPCCVKIAETRAMMAVLKDANISFDEFPKTTTYMNMIIKSYYRDIFGFGTTNVSIIKQEYRKEDFNRLVNQIKHRKDELFGQKLIRILNVGSCDYRVKANSCYKFCANRCAGFDCFYGGSDSMARATVEYMQEVGVLIQVLEDTIKNFDKLWKTYLRALIANAIKDNPVDYLRMADRKGAPVKSKKMVR